MGKLFHLLLVAGSENDALLLLDELRKNGREPDYERVRNASEMAAALERRAWDAVISDYALPEFSGPAALKLLREKNPDVPFITVSNALGGDAVMEMMRAGANDWMAKGDLSRLVPAMEREMEAAQLRRATRFFAAIVECADDAIYGRMLDGTVVSWNHAAERIFGYRADEIIGCSVALLFPIDRRDELENITERINRGERVGLHETERVHKDGRHVSVALTVSPILDGEKKVIGISAIARDITRQKHDDAERSKLIQKLLETVKQVKTLNGLMSICSACKRIRDDDGHWLQPETYISSHSSAVFSHSICPDCLGKYQSVEKVKI